MSKKLEKVLEYLVNNQEDKAKELLHQVFIEKARAIHEEMMNDDEEDFEEMGGDMGYNLKDEVSADSEELDELSHEIETEETMAEMDMADAEDDLSDELSGDELSGDELSGDDMSDDQMQPMDDEMPAEESPGIDSEDLSSIEKTMDALEDALAKFKDEFDKIEKGLLAAEEDGIEPESDMEIDADEELPTDSEDMKDAEEHDAKDSNEEEDGDEEMDESWLKEFDDLDESIDLEKVSAPAGDEVGSGKFAKPDSSKVSPVGKAPESMLGAKPVATGKGPIKSGFEREAAPSVEQLKGMKPDNRRKKAEDGMGKVSKEGDGSAMLNKKIGAENVKSPLSTSPRK